jgi:sensor c-di-GMP phosphodiesterase-like protein
MRRAGILKRIDNNYWTPKLEEILRDSPKAVTSETVMAYFMFLAAGILVSILILMMEIRYRKR